MLRCPCLYALRATGTALRAALRVATPQVNCGYCVGAAPLAVSAQRFTDKESRDEPRSARLREHFGSVRKVLHIWKMEVAPQIG